MNENQNPGEERKPATPEATSASQKPFVTMGDALAEALGELSASEHAAELTPEAAAASDLERLERLEEKFAEAEERAERWKNRFIIACILVLILGAIAYPQPSIEFTPDADNTTVLHYTRHYPFTHNFKLRLEARPDPDDENRVKWMYQTDPNTWYPLPAIYGDDLDPQ